MQNILIGVSGSIAAYKSLLLVRLLVKSGRNVKVVMTSAATEFVAPLSFSTLSKNDVYIDVVSEESWNNHVELGLWADAYIIAPATANTLSKLASGQSDNMIVATYLSARCPVYIAPAMDLDMWKHPSTKANINLLKSYGNEIIPVGVGELASGLVGEGRMAEPEDIVDFLAIANKKKVDLAGKKVLITAGPTRESIDPVRFITNHSSGRMGIALADECASRGADVHLIVGPSNLSPISESVSVIKVESAREMYEACQHEWGTSDILIFAAAVADYTPISRSEVKVKKKEGDLSIDLKRTIDIAGSFGKIKRSDQLSIGFALETNNEQQNAKTKLNKKNFDMIVLNSLNDEGAGFGTTTNKISIFRNAGDPKSFALKSKKEVAADIIDEIVDIIQN